MRILVPLWKHQRYKTPGNMSRSDIKAETEDDLEAVKLKLKINSEVGRSETRQKTVDTQVKVEEPSQFLGFFL